MKKLGLNVGYVVGVSSRSNMCVLGNLHNIGHLLQLLESCPSLSSWPKVEPISLFCSLRQYCYNPLGPLIVVLSLSHSQHALVLKLLLLNKLWTTDSFGATSCNVVKVHTWVRVRPNPPPLSVLVRVVALRITCVIPKLVVTQNVTPISMNSQLTQNHDVLLMLASWIGEELAFSRVQPAALATQTLKDIALETLALANGLSSVLFTSVGL